MSGFYIREVDVPTLTGGNGAATGKASIGLNECRIVAIGIEYADNALPAGTTVTVTSQAPWASKTLLAVTGNTSFAPRNLSEPFVDSAYNDRAAYWFPPHIGDVVVTVTNSNASTNGIKVVVMMEL